MFLTYFTLLVNYDYEKENSYVEGIPSWGT